MKEDNDARSAAIRIDPERLAAFLDGRLSAQERAALMEQLAASPEDLEIVADVIAASQDAAEGTDAAPAGPAPTGAASPVSMETARPRRWLASPATRWIAAAAVVVLAVGITLSVRGAGGPPRPSAYAALLDEPGVSLPGGWMERGNPVVRGSAGGASSIQARSVMLGGLLIDLRVAAARDSASARPIAARIQQLLATSPAASTVTEAYGSLASGHTPLQAAPLDAAERQLLDLAPLVDRDALAAGAWLRAAWLAANAHDADFFAQQPSAAAADRVDRSLSLGPDSTGGARWALRAAEGGRWDEAQGALISLRERLARR